MKKASPYRDLYVEEKPEAELAELTWKYHKSCHDSVIQDIFCGISAQCLKATLYVPGGAVELVGLYHLRVFSHLYTGQLQSTIECSVCHHKSHCFDPFMDLSLPLPKRETRNYQSRGKVTLQDCLAAFVAPELLDGSNKWFCSGCKVHRISKHPSPCSLLDFRFSTTCLFAPFSGAQFSFEQVELPVCNDNLLTCAF